MMKRALERTPSMWLDQHWLERLDRGRMGPIYHLSQNTASLDQRGQDGEK